MKIQLIIFQNRARNRKSNHSEYSAFKNQDFLNVVYGNNLSSFLTITFVLMQNFELFKILKINYISR